MDADIALVEADPDQMQRVVEAETVEAVKDAIATKYGIEITDRYAADFIAFWRQIYAGYADGL